MSWPGLQFFERKCVEPQKRAFNRGGNFYQCAEVKVLVLFFVPLFLKGLYLRIRLHRESIISCVGNATSIASI
jgi:hypothetical protein